MRRPLSAAAERVLGTLPPWYSEDETARAIVDAKARELQRLDDFYAEIRRQMNPQFADDTYGILAMWEDRFGLPVKPAGVSVVARRDKVLAHIKTRKSSAGSDWEDSVATAMGTTSWNYTEGPGNYVVTVRFPYASGGYSTSTAMNLIIGFTPAHIQIIPAYTQGWLAGISLVGVEPL